MTYLPENVWVEIYTVVDGLPTWTNIGDSINSDIDVNIGFSDGDPLSRLAPGGDMRFDLMNSDSAFNPSASFYKGQKIRLRIKYGSLIKVKFFGYIDVITLDVGTWGPQQAHVIAVDWLALAAKTPVRAIPGMTNTTIDLAVARLLQEMQLQPEAVDFEVGNITLPYVFDQITPNSTVYSELNNLIMGEFGYGYMRDGGMTLKIENSLSRTGDGSDYKTTSFYNPDGVEEDFMLLDGTNFLLLDGTNFLLNGEPTAGSFDSDLDETYINSPSGIRIIHGDQLTNKISASAIPTIVGGSVLTLYPFDIASGSKALLVPTNSADNPYIIQGQYKDPTAGGAQISGSSVVTPVVSTDWRFNSLATGLGSDLSANITITFTAGASGFKASIVNMGAPGYFTRFNVRGVPIYRYNPVETVVKDQRSIWDYGDYSLQFTRQYGATSDDIQPFMFRLLMRDRKPRTIASNPKFKGYDTLDHLAGFLLLDIGDQIRLASTQPATDALYYIQGGRFSIKPGGESIIMDYVTTETLAGAIEGVTEIALEQTPDSSYGVNFRYLPSASNHVQRSITARIYLHSPTGGAAFFGIESCCYFGIAFLSSKWRLKHEKYYTTTLGRWEQSSSEIIQDTWCDVAMTLDSSSVSNVPIFYIDGVVVSVNTGSVPVGTPIVETGHPLSVGNYIEATLIPAISFPGKYENVAVYNRILAPAEISTIHNGGTRLPFASYPMTDLKFFFGGMDSESYTDKLNTALGPLDTVYDLVNGFTGQPMSSPTLRAVG